MVEKTLSSGTLNLKFMQNARRTQQLSRVEPEQAYVKDDAEWQVPAETREAWGLSAYHGEKAGSITYETSYLPFLFPSLHDTHVAAEASYLSPQNAIRPRGRRAFNKRGEEITQQVSSSTTDAAPPENTASLDPDAGEHTKNIRLHSISAVGKSAAAARQVKKSSKDPSKDAKAIIFDTTGVGIDLRQSSKPGIVAAPSSSAFIRPAGVEAPAKFTKHSGSMNSTDGAQSSAGATDPGKVKVKRSRPLGDKDKPKKKTKLTLIE
ncbi:hypothetical protein PAXRUDRAFT_233730 [Paxillus rubicundulus Ve08.2h10]|uniref:Uncharacterized protein n=1 Tax=Paxillus rubicundulus Ve08.2h10 TaxID=930991 RepID=A0A0D0E126_9AGAM|nr:hypothetical protein PAXRUDRAFT_233730 [Paxillus rubicundulus Ve08.2h10]